MSKKVILLMLILLFSKHDINSQTGSKNIYYLDIGINLFAVGIGVNYERMFSENMSIRVGANIGTIIWSSKGNESGIGFPVTINYMTNKTGKFEIGGGAGLRINLLEKGKLEIWPAGRIGYRNQPENNGIMWRCVLDFPANCYLSNLSFGFTN
jgi:hypothetical protein